MRQPRPADPAEVRAFRAAHARVLERIATAAGRAGRDPRAVILVSVSKTVPAERLLSALAAGISLFGENRVQEAESKMAQLPGARWHLVGHLQGNKAARALRTFEVIESVDSLELAQRLDRLAGESAGRAAPTGPGERAATARLAGATAAPGAPEMHPPGPAARPGVYLQVNVDRDPAKAGFAPDELDRALPELAALEHLELLGLMTVGRLVERAEQARPTFVRLRELSERLRASATGLGPGLSMGMSDDFEVAVEEGATLVRIGRAIFGERPGA